MAHDRDSAEAGACLATVSTLIVADDDRRGELFDAMRLVLDDDP